MANETSQFLAVVQPITTEVLFYRRFVQQPVQRAATVVFFVIKMRRNLTELACMRNVSERCWVCHLYRVEKLAHGVTNDCSQSPVWTRIGICALF